MGEELPPDLTLLAPDRLGWEGDGLPEDYGATTLDEQAEAAAALIAGDDAPALLTGAGIGAAIALALLLRGDGATSGAVLIEPPLLAFVPAATAALSADRAALGDAVNEGGLDAGVALYLSGEMQGLGPGAGRLPEELTAPARDRPRSLFAELGAVPGWNLPFAELRGVAAPSRIVISEGTPPFLREAAEQLAARLANSELTEVPGEGPAHVDAPADVARVAAGLSAG
jgi:pimeloyl-ACP methyl ester carboxylesterase